jgi:metal-responsive CopG/Arc/MetJ family transcriptional regulator
MNSTDQKNQDTVMIDISLPSALLAEVEAAVNDRYADRDEFIREALRRYLEHIRTTKVAA